MNKLKSFLRKDIITIVLIITTAIILGLSIRGNAGNPSMVELSGMEWKENGPFELSPERGRYALTYSIIEDNSFSFSRPTAEFASPDVGIKNGKYVSIFAPLLSFIIVPGYIVGKYFGIAQVGSFAIVAIFALINVFLLRNIAIRLGANPVAASISSLIFLFGTPAFAYAVNLYQHHISTFLMLISIYALLRFKNLLAYIIVFLAFGMAIPLDYPNLFFLFPIAIYAGLKVFSYEKISNKFTLKINVAKLFSPLVVILPILFFLWFNQMTYGNPFQLSGTVPAANLGIKNIESAVSLEKATGQVEKDNESRSAVGFFETRNILNGFYILFISPDRGIIYYAPIVIFGIIGFFLAYKRNFAYLGLFGSIICVNILLYSMWGDPWGGWAFGARYLIPSYALISVFIALLLTYWRKKILFLVVFAMFAIYSIAINTLGAITTSAIPPKVQVLELEKLSGIIQRYTYQRNWEFLVAGQSKAFSYQDFFYNYLTPMEFYQLLLGSILLLVGGLLVYYVFFTKEVKSNV